MKKTHRKSEMEILRFVKWRWNKMDSTDKFLLFIIPWTLFAIVSIFIFGPEAILIFLAGLTFVLVCWLVRISSSHLHKSWQEFKRTKDAEADEIVSRLKGTQ